MKAALPTHAALALATLVTTGCIFVDGRDRYDERYDEGPGTQPAPRVAQAVIDAGATLEFDPGWGAGLFVEYEGSGRYRLSTACDTELSGYSCIFDVFVDAPGLELIDAAELDDTDWVTAGRDTLDLELETAFEVDSVVVRTRPGVTLRVELYLDGYRDARFIYWIGDGVIHEGAPTNPMDFIPSE